MHSGRPRRDRQGRDRVIDDDAALGCPFSRARRDVGPWRGARVAEEFSKVMAARGVPVSVQHIRDADPKRLAPADLYVFSSPGHFGKPKRDALRFLRKVSLEPATEYGILATQGAPKPNPKTGQTPTQEELDRWERVIPIMNEELERKGLRRIADGAVLVTGIKGPLESGWQQKVLAFADQITSALHIQAG